MSFHETMKLLVDYADPYLWFILSFIAFLIGIIKVSPVHYDPKAHLSENILVYIRKIALISFALLSLPLPFFLWMAFTSQFNWTMDYTASTFMTWYKQMSIHWLWVIGWYIIGFAGKFYAVRYLRPKISEFKRSLRVYQNMDELSDIRDEKQLHQPKNFDPQQYYKEGYLFLGLDVGNQPIYVEWDVWLKLNTQIIGPTRFGKGVLFGVMIDQAILFGNTVIYIDPKQDEFIPHIMADRAKKMGRKFYYFDLNDPNSTEPNPGEYGPFMGGDIRSKRARLLIAAGLASSGTDADYYKGKERRVVDELLNKTGGRIDLMLQAFKDNEDYKEEASRLYNMLFEWSQIKSLCPKSTKHGLSIERTLLKNSILYIRGSLDDEVIREATKILIIELIQEIKRLKNKRNTYVSLFVDEVRFLTSNALVDALATMLGNKANASLAYQSKEDIRNLTDKTLDPSSIQKSIDTNCQLKFIYGTQDPETAEWGAKMSGEQIKKIAKTEHTHIGHVGEEVWEHHRTIVTQEVPYIPENTFYSLEPRVGVLFHIGKLTQVVHTCFVPTKANNDLSKTEVV